MRDKITTIIEKTKKLLGENSLKNFTISMIIGFKIYFNTII
ncbi:MAG: hypothetical protein O210_OD1C00001G0175 [Parcubacteria bacterium RAAC4_OD1_1]|nr:MAG: hypothetical protein O210_OD1C00001G0175 [Parcubacteria bacterium RAAC4_OD1_1]